MGRNGAVVLRVREEGHDADVAPLEPGAGALAEDEVRGAGDVGLRVEVAAGVGEQGVLVAGQGAAVVALFLRVREGGRC